MPSKAFHLSIFGFILVILFVSSADALENPHRREGALDNPYRAGYSPSNQEASYIAKTQLYVKDRLGDSSGTRFRSMYVSRKIGEPVVCGQINAKSGFDGYSGWQRFIAGPDLVFIEEMMPAGEMEQSWAQVCT